MPDPDQDQDDFAAQAAETGRSSLVREFVEFLGELPRTAAKGEIDRPALRRRGRA